MVMDLTEAEDIKKRWQEYTEELYKKYHHNPDNHDDVITDLEPGILESDLPYTHTHTYTHSFTTAFDPQKSCKDTTDSRVRLSRR